MSTPGASGGNLRIPTRPLVPGTAAGPILVLDQPLSLWGGIDCETGRIIDRRHPQRGARVTSTMLVLPGGRGSSSSSSILAEAVRRGTAPAAILLGAIDEIIALGALVAIELYRAAPPIVVLSPDHYPLLASGDQGRLSADGTLLVLRTQDPGEH